MPQYLAISANQAGDNTIVEATEGTRIHVLNYLIVAANDVTVTWKSGSTAISGAMAIAANGGISAAGGGGPTGGNTGVWLRTSAGEALVLNLSGGVQVSGHIVVNV